MTDEPLIEARQALDILHRYSFGSKEIGREQVAEHVQVVSDALAVFEKAHTPSSDEREALAKAMCAIETRSKAATLEEVQAGIQRWTRHRYEADRLFEELADYGVSLRRSEVPEPSGDEVDAMAYLITSHRFRERGLSGAIGEPDVAVARPLAEFLHREGFRRTEVPEPSARLATSAEQELAKAHSSERDAGDNQVSDCREDQEHVEIISDDRADPQGEPSCVCRPGRVEFLDCRVHGEPQGEPSDAQEVEFPFTHEGVTLEQDDGGMWVSDGGGSSYWISPRVLAALRAASGQGGEAR